MSWLQSASNGFGFRRQREDLVNANGYNRLQMASASEKSSLHDRQSGVYHGEYTEWLNSASNDLDMMLGKSSA